LAQKEINFRVLENTLGGPAVVRKKQTAAPSSNALDEPGRTLLLRGDNEGLFESHISKNSSRLAA